MFAIRSFGRSVLKGMAAAFLAMSLSSAATAEEPELDRELPVGMFQYLSDFVERTYLSGSIARDNLYRVYYAPKLQRYWQRRNVPLSEVIADKKRHFKRWPFTSYRLDSRTLEIYSIVGVKDAYAVRFDYEYDARRPGRTTAGRGRTEMLLRVIDGTPVIYREVGRVLERE